LVPNGKPINIIRHITPGVCENLSTLEGITQQEMNKSIEVNYKSFSGFTFPSSVRDDEPLSFDGKEIYVNSKNYAQIDFTDNFTFKFSKAGDLKKPVTPITGDLLMIYVSNDVIDKHKRNQYNQRVTNNFRAGTNNRNQNLKNSANLSAKAPEAEMWCIISDQFLRAWTAIMYDSHETFDKLIGNKNITNIVQREALLRKKLLSGNRITTNSWLKHKLTLDGLKKEMTPKESSEKYWHLRTEKASREYVDIYAALVLIARYGEIPCAVNVPVTKVTIDNIEYDRPKWSLPNSFVDCLLCDTVNLSIKDIDNYYVWAGVCECTQLLSSEMNGSGLFQKSINVPISQLSQNTETTKLISSSNSPKQTDEIVLKVQNMEWVSIVKGNSSRLESGISSQSGLGTINVKIQKEKQPSVKLTKDISMQQIQPTIPTTSNTSQKVDDITKLIEDIQLNPVLNRDLLMKETGACEEQIVIQEQKFSVPIPQLTTITDSKKPNTTRRASEGGIEQVQQVSITVKVKSKWSEVICTSGEDEF
jgi:hypothetical protein